MGSMGFKGVLPSHFDIELFIEYQQLLFHLCFGANEK